MKGLAHNCLGCILHNLGDVIIAMMVYVSGHGVSEHSDVWVWAHAATASNAQITDKCFVQALQSMQVPEKQQPEPLIQTAFI